MYIVESSPICKFFLISLQRGDESPYGSFEFPFIVGTLRALQFACCSLQVSLPKRKRGRHASKSPPRVNAEKASRFTINLSLTMEALPHLPWLNSFMDASPEFRKAVQ